MTENDPTPLRVENLRQKHLVDQAIQTAHPLLINTHLLAIDSPLDQSDVSTVEKALQIVFPVDRDNYKTHAHLQLATEFGRIFAEKLGLNPYEIQLILLGHDDGRFITQRWLRNELVAGYTFNKLGIRNDLMEKAPKPIWHIPKVINEQAMQDSFNKMTDLERVVTAADICGKRKFDDWGILTFDEIMNYHNRQRTKEKGQMLMQDRSDIFPSERKLTPELIKFDAMLYEKIRAWLLDRGIDVEQVRQDILLKEKNAPIKAIIFDIGDVLIPNPDPEMFKAFGEGLNLSPDVVAKHFIKAAQQFRTGEINGEEFFQRLSDEINLPLTQEIRKSITTGLSYTIRPDMLRVLETLHKKGYILATLSDTIPPHVRFLREKGFFNDFDITMTSVGFKASKKDHPEEVFGCALVKLNLPAGACVFIDDKKKYVEKAQVLGLSGIQYQILDPVSTLEDRLRMLHVTI